MKMFKSEVPVLSPQDKVTINIWLPVLNGECSTWTTWLQAYSAGTVDGATSRIGHASIETANTYASWWPNPSNTEEVGICNVVNATNNTEYGRDCDSEKVTGNESGQPHYKITLYSLNVIEIESCFNAIENSPYGFVLAGDKKLTRLFNSEKGQNCSGLAYELLVAGGILKLSSFYQDITCKWVIVTPENLANLVMNAKRWEQYHHPETLTFPEEAGVDFSYLEEAQSGCVIS